MKVLEQTQDGSVFILEGDFSDQGFRKRAAERALSKQKKSGKTSGKFVLDRKPVEWTARWQCDEQVVALFEEGNSAFGLTEEDLSSLIGQVDHDTAMLLIYRVLGDVIPDMIPAIKMMVDEDLYGAMMEIMGRVENAGSPEVVEAVNIREMDRHGSIASLKIDSLNRLANLTVQELDELADKYASQYHNIW